MSENHDVTIEDEGREPAAAPGPAPAAAPLVVIEYRSRFVPSVLIPPVLILVVVLTIQSYQRLTPVRVHPPDPSPSEGQGEGRTILVEPSGLGAAYDPVEVRAESAQAPAPVPAPAADPAPAAAPPVAPTVIASTTAPADTAASPFDIDPAEASGNQSPAPAPEAKPVVAAPAPMAPPDERAAIGFQVPPAPPAVELPPANPTPPEVTTEDVLADVEREAARKNAERKALEEFKPRRKMLELADTLQRTQEARLPFHNELRDLLRTRGDQAGPEIENLCEKYGRTTLPEVEAAVRRVLGRSGTTGGLPLRAKVEQMRWYGLPEPKIFDYVAHSVHRTVNSRGGPRNEDEVRIQAAKMLLAMPVAPKPGPIATKPVARTVPAPGFGAARPAQ